MCVGKGPEAAIIVCSFAITMLLLLLRRPHYGKALFCLEMCIRDRLLVIAFLGGLLGDAGCMILLLVAVFGGTAWIYLYSYLVYIGKMK